MSTFAQTKTCLLPVLAARTQISRHAFVCARLQCAGRRSVDTLFDYNVERDVDLGVRHKDIIAPGQERARRNDPGLRQPENRQRCRGSCAAADPLVLGNFVALWRKTEKVQRRNWSCTAQHGVVEGALASFEGKIDLRGERNPISLITRALRGFALVL